MSIGDRLGWFAIILIAAMLAPQLPYVALAIVIGVVALRVGRKIDLRASERQRLLSDCDRQHRELMEGGQVIIPPTLYIDYIEQVRLSSTEGCR